VAAAAKQAMGASKPIDGPAFVRLGIYLPIPKSWSKSKRAQAMAGALFPISKSNGDSDNHAKAVLDGMNGIVLEDDGQAVDLYVTKRYSDKPGVWVEVIVMEVIAPE
jgi:Holliday junction resolvase RusA-like endonuclease